MNTKIISLVVAAVLLGACFPGQPMDTVVLDACPAGKTTERIDKSAPAYCNSNAQWIFHVGESFLKVTPPTICIKAGTSRVATIHPHGNYEINLNDVNTTPEDSSVDWLDRNNSNAANKLKIEIQVPQATEAGHYKYCLKVKGVGQLDPIVKVVE